MGIFQGILSVTFRETFYQLKESCGMSHAARFDSPPVIPLSHFRL